MIKNFLLILIRGSGGIYMSDLQIKIKVKGSGTVK